MILVYDTETTGLPRDWNAPLTDSENWPRLVQLAWQLHTPEGKLVSRGNHIVKPEGFTIPYNSAKVHGITTERAQAEGIGLDQVLAAFNEDLDRAEYVMGHNVEFDVNIIGAELIRRGSGPERVTDKAVIDSKDEATDFCAIPGGKGGKFKWPTLTELHTKLFGAGFGDAHDAAYDVDATARCFFALVQRGVIVRPGFPTGEGIRYEAPKLEAANFAAQKKTTPAQGPAKGVPTPAAGAAAVADVPFSHLHVHSQFSVLQATSSVQALVAKAVETGMPAMGLTDRGNMMGAFQFVRAANKAGIKPIVGAELNVCRDHADRSKKDDGYPIVLLARNRNGYHGLAKLSSLAFTQGFYYVPRIDREQLLEYKDDLMVLTGGLFSEVPSLLLNVGDHQAEEAFLWWKEHFGPHFYAELNRHGLEEEKVVNDFLLQMCAKHDVRYIPANNSFYTTRKEADAHDILLCVKDAANVSQPKRYTGKRGREFRFGLPNDEFYLKSPEEMKQLFADVPEAFETVREIVDGCEGYVLERDVLLPAFDIPEEFVDPLDATDKGKRGENAYLRHLTYKGAEKRYPEITEEIRQRLDFELDTIERTGYPGYFLIVQDFTTAAREMGVSVGPGRGSAAGSAVAYCTGITNMDPIEYDLLFERFLNPDRVSLPDIDIDFDDEGRGKVIDYVINKYGANQVAQIITYGTLAAKSSLKDTARVMELPHHEADRLSKQMPDISLAKLFKLSDPELKEKLRGQEGLDMANAIKAIHDRDDLEGEVVRKARIIEGSVRNTGIHACGVIITPDDITNFVPVATAKDSDMVCTQFDNAVAEDAGLLKMDFLGLRTLTIIKDAVENIRKRSGVTMDPEAFPLDDETTYALFQRGDTVGIFQYESVGMQRYLKELKPTEFADLIAMNALYRPGPLEYIPAFVRRKHGKEPVTYDLAACEEYLAETYGITVYQEQVMLLSQKLAGFTKGEADTLRKAMGKKKADLIAQMKPKFMEGGAERDHDAETLEKIWKDWEAFASYAFNKSHSTCYAWVAYQTAYLKANHPAEFMAAVLSNNMSDIKKVTFFMKECQRMGVPVLGPDINESEYKFAVNAEGAIRFGLGAMSGVGEGAVASIVDSRGEAPYNSIFDFATKVSLKDCNKRVFEALARGGGFDDLPQSIFRAQCFAEDIKGRSTIELAIRYGQATQESENSSQASLFGGDSGAMEIPEPPVPVCEEWEPFDKLAREKEVVGVYLSGHPLDQFKVQLDQFCTKGGLGNLEDLEAARGRTISFGGMVTHAEHKMGKNGNPWGEMVVEDYHGARRMPFWKQDYVNYKGYMTQGWFIFVKGKVQMKQFRGAEEMEFKVQRIELLADVLEKLAGRLRVQLDLKKLNDSMVQEVCKLIESHEGGVGVTVEIHHPDAVLEMPSRRKKVELSPALLDGLEAMDGVNFKVLGSGG